MRNAPIVTTLLIMLLGAGCPSSGGTNDAAGGAPERTDGRVADGGSPTEVGGPAKVDAGDAPDTTFASDAPDGGGGDTPRPETGDATDAAFAPPAICDGITVRGSQVTAVVEATVTAEGFGPTNGCEGDLPRVVQVKRTMCGSVPTEAKVVALTDPSPVHTGLLTVGERRILLLDLSSCPAYAPKSVYVVVENRPPSDWDSLAVMLRPRDGGN